MGFADASGLLAPRDLLEIATEAELVQKREEALQKREQSDMQRSLHESFLAQTIAPDVGENLMHLVKKTAKTGAREVLVMHFPASYCVDGGRAINNFEKDWPSSLDGVAKRGYEWFVHNLQPLGYRLRAEILDFPHGMPGEVGIYLCW